jgi:hypothetical protein
LLIIAFVLAFLSDERCTGHRTITVQIEGLLPQVLPIAADMLPNGHKLKARHIPLRLVLVEHHDGIEAPPRNVSYALHTLLHHTHGHFTGHGFVAKGQNAPPYVFFHDAADRPLARPAPRDLHNVISYDEDVSRAWYTRVGVVE